MKKDNEKKQKKTTLNNVFFGHEQGVLNTFNN